MNNIKDLIALDLDLTQEIERTRTVLANLKLTQQSVRDARAITDNLSFLSDIDKSVQKTESVLRNLKKQQIKLENQLEKQLYEK